MKVKLHFMMHLSDNNSAKELMGDELLVKISREVAEKLRKNVSVDWNVKESVRAKLRLIIKNISEEI